MVNEFQSCAWMYYFQWSPFFLVLQVDLLQSQSEVKQLLDRVAGAAQERAEMVSSKVHVQLLQIADDRALAAEQKARELEKEVCVCVCVCMYAF